MWCGNLSYCYLRLYIVHGLPCVYGVKSNGKAAFWVEGNSCQIGSANKYGNLLCLALFAMRSTGLGRVGDGATDACLGLLVYRIDGNDWAWDGMG